jgi:hypothetical protein
VRGRVRFAGIAPLTSPYRPTAVATAIIPKTARSGSDAKTLAPYWRLAMTNSTVPGAYSKSDSSRNFGPAEWNIASA